ncbi:hypothetical protein CDD82_5217 [Ophiocordyceps australis]|uniref:EF-hand domain-containing protein n=1 Tax=Ophiocordyceps australis TaxID=1399860 RepID=A0A2C5ZNM8_9HYPO|nr:hypothetical protein CDD82_5217 [Ophiocordyceps australis]
MSDLSTPYRPSPLGYGPSPSRSSPFRRAESSVSPSPLRHTTPSSAPSKPKLVSSLASRLAIYSSPPSTQQSWTPRGHTPEPAMASTPRPQRPELGSRATSSKSLGNGNALSQLHPTQVRTMRDGFQILDRDCDGVVNGGDVADMLSQLGLPNGPADVARFFPPSRPQTIALGAFLNSLAETLAALSPNAELLSAFSAFDDDDSGQINWAELRDALINTAPEAGEAPLTAGHVDKVVDGFTGRRAFNRNMSAQLGAKKGEVFKYHDFVNSIMGSNGAPEGESNESADD